METQEIIFDFKRFCKGKDDESIEDLANDFMYENRLYGEDLFNILIKIKI